MAINGNKWYKNAAFWTLLVNKWAFYLEKVDIYDVGCVMPIYCHLLPFIAIYSLKVAVKVLNVVGAVDVVIELENVP